MFKFSLPSAFEHRRSGGLSGIVRHTVTLIAVLSAGVAVMGAQTDSHSQTSLNLKAPAMLSSSDAVFSSSAATSATSDAGTPVNEASVVAMTPNFAELMQYGGGSASATAGHATAGTTRMRMGRASGSSLAALASLSQLGTRGTI